MTVGSNIAQELDQRLTYIFPVVEVPTVEVLTAEVPTVEVLTVEVPTVEVLGAAAPLEIIIPSVLGVIVMIVCVVLIIFVCFYLNLRRKTVSIVTHEQILELVDDR